MYLEIITFPGLFQVYLGDPHILEFIFIVIEFYQYGTYNGLIRSKKPIWDPCRTQMGLMPRICPYGSHIYMFAGRILPMWDLYGSYMGKKSLYGAHVGPEWDKCPDSAHMGHIYTCLLGYCDSDQTTYYAVWSVCSGHVYTRQNFLPHRKVYSRIFFSFAMQTN